MISWRKLRLLAACLLLVIGCRDPRGLESGRVVAAADEKTPRGQAVALAKAIGNPSELAWRVAPDQEWLTASATNRAGRGPGPAVLHASDLRRAFPNLKSTIRRVVEGNDFVLVEGLLEGTHAATFGGRPATGRRVQSAFAELSLLRDRTLKATIVFLDNDRMVRPIDDSRQEPSLAPRPAVVLGKPVKLPKAALSRFFGVLGYAAAAKVAAAQGDVAYAMSVEQPVAPSVLEEKAPALIARYKRLVPNLSVRILDIHGAGPIVAVRGEATGVRAGKPLLIPMLLIAEFEGLLIKFVRVYANEI